MSRTLDQIFELMDSLHYYEAQLERFTTSRQVLADLLSNIINYQTTMIIIENGVITQVFPNGSAPGNVFCAGSTTATSSVLGSVTIGHPGGIQITVGEGRITITGQGSQNFNGVEISSLQSEARYLFNRLWIGNLLATEHKNRPLEPLKSKTLPHSIQLDHNVCVSPPG
ncbi:hypothetical protein BDZ45DRAFT_796490 [Acephala macrosclerotiorum]|nr:hypothetical protein BDZ45DRAFT_796490 [Acephala macrosclerotiorum]